MSQIANSFVHVNAESTPASTLKALRLSAGLTQDQLAKKAGLDRSWVNQMERGRKPITATPRAKLAAALGVSPMELGGEDDATPEYVSVLDRLAALEERIEKEQQLRLRAMRAVTRRLAVLEAALDSLEQREDRQRSSQ